MRRERSDCLDGFAVHLVKALRLIIGLLLVVSVVVYLVAAYARAPKQRRFPAWGWVGLAILGGAEALRFARFRWVAIYFTPIAWTGYLLLIDAAIFSLRGESRLAGARREFLKLTFWSVPLWLIFEAYNLRLENWTYVGLPGEPAAPSGGICLVVRNHLAGHLGDGGFPGGPPSGAGARRAPRRARPPRASEPSHAGAGNGSPYPRWPRNLWGSIFSARSGWGSRSSSIRSTTSPGSAPCSATWKPGGGQTFYSLLGSGWVCGVLWGVLELLGGRAVALRLSHPARLEDFRDAPARLSRLPALCRGVLRDVRIPRHIAGAGNCASQSTTRGSCLLRAGNRRGLLGMLGQETAARLPASFDGERTVSSNCESTVAATSIQNPQSKMRRRVAK